MSSARDADARHHPDRDRARDDLLDPRTQIVSDREAYLGQGRNDIGRRISDDQVELFITADVASSLQHEFALHTPEFVALHDVGTSASLRLLNSLAGAAGARVQRLSVRRQGHGVALAVLQFVEMPLADGTVVRVYSTDLNGDNATRQNVGRVMLAHSQLGVLLVGELPPHALTGRIAPLREALQRGPWPNQDLLLLPLGSSQALAVQATQLAAGTNVGVHVAPHASNPRQAWSYVAGAWNRLHDRPGGQHGLQTDLALAVPKPQVPLSEAITEPMPLPAAPEEPPAPVVPTPMPVPGRTRWQEYADRCLKIKGSIACCVFDTHSGQALAFAGGPPTGERLAQQGTLLLGQMNDASRSLGLGAGRVEAAVSTAHHHLLLRPVPGHPGVALHLVVLASTGNVTLARMQLERIESPA